MKTLAQAAIISLFYISFAHPYCFEAAGNYYGVPPILLWAIAKVESNFQPYAIGYKENGTFKSAFPTNLEEAKTLIDTLWANDSNFDLGVGQINRQNIKAHGINPYDLLDPCYNVYWSAYILRTMIDRWGYTWEGISHYNGGGLKYSEKVWTVLEEINNQAGSK